MKLHHRIICIIIMVVVLKGRDINNPSKNDHEGLKIDLIVKLHSSFFYSVLSSNDSFVLRQTNKSTYSGLSWPMLWQSECSLLQC